MANRKNGCGDMAKKYLSKVLIFLCIVIVVGISATIYKKMVGTDIRHYAQYIFPCKGQISTLKNESTFINFYVLDEKKISELSNKENIKKIYLTTKDNENIEVQDWKIEEAFEFSQADKFYSKKLSLNITVNKEEIIQKLNIQYADETETFEIGNLRVCPIDNSNEMSSIWISSDPSLHVDKMDETDELMDLESHMEAMPPTFTMLSFSINSMLDDMTINSIDFGIKGMGVDPETCKQIPYETDFGTAFTKDPANQVYTTAECMNQLPTQEMNLEIRRTDNEEIIYLVALRKNKKYVEEACSLYISPIYSCTDNTTDVNFLFGDPMYYIMLPQILNNHVAEELLKELGK